MQNHIEEKLLKLKISRNESVRTLKIQEKPTKFGPKKYFLKKNNYEKTNKN